LQRVIQVHFGNGRIDPDLQRQDVDLAQHCHHGFLLLARPIDQHCVVLRVGNDAHRIEVGLRPVALAQAAKQRGRAALRGLI
jgi:hypothetical protein